MRHLSLSALLIFFAACGNSGLEVTVGSPDGGTTSASDTAIANNEDNNSSVDMGGTVDMPTVGPGDLGPSDDGGNPVDMAPPPMCNPDDCGPGASCQNNVCTCDDGLLGDPLVGCSAENPCDGVTCPAGSSCSSDGSCDCDPFFSGDPTTGCEPTVPAADLAARSMADVCAIWTDQYQRSSQDFWLIEPNPADVCDPGVLHPEELRDALHTTSRYRMLVGLHPVSFAQGAQQTTQECAMMHNANDARLNHEPPATWDCYTQTGYNGCSSSNLANGVRDPAGTVRVYINEFMVDSLGHRRWIFNPGMGATAFGHRGTYGAMYAFDGSRSHDPSFVAYPAPGPFPRDAITGKWSIHGGANYQADFTVTITNLGDNSDVPVNNVMAPVFGNLASTLSWEVSTNQLPVDTTYRIEIRDSGGAMVQTYETTLVDCP